MPEAPAWHVDPSRSEIRVLVYRGGPLARFGHNHVLTGAPEGIIHVGDTSERSGFRLQMNVTEMSVDAPAARMNEGEAFTADVSDEARRGTRRNMLGPEVLDAENFPLIELQSIALHGPRWNPDVRARLILRGVARDIEFPAAVFLTDDRLNVIASFRIRTSDFGIAPFSVLGGGLQVQDEFRIRVNLIAAREMP